MTEYDPLPRHHKMRWLLTGGDIVEEPDLEQSPEGRRVRVVGTRKSVYTKDLDQLIYASVSQFAEQRGEKVWMRVLKDDPVAELTNNFGQVKPAEKPHFIEAQESDYYGHLSKLVWEFRHPTLPVAARLVLEMKQFQNRYNHRSQSNNGNQQSVAVTLEYPSTHPADAYIKTFFQIQSDEDFTFAKIGDGDLGHAQRQQDFADWQRRNKMEWSRVLGQTTYTNEREAAVAIARAVREIESLDCIFIPDLRDPGKPAWLELGLYNTTLTTQFKSSLLDFINGQPVVEKVKEHWDAIVDLLRQTGLVVSSLEQSELHNLLQGGDQEVYIDNPTAPDEEGGRDHQHKVGMNLLTGTITVTCSVRDTTTEDVATQYEIARIKAEAKGELDAFLQFEAGFLGTKHEARHKRTVEQRTVDEDELDDLFDPAL